MTAVNISLPESLKAFAEEQAVKGGYESVSEYLGMLIREAQRREAQEELEGKLLEGLETPGREMKDEDWDRVQADVRQRCKKAEDS